MNGTAVLYGGPADGRAETIPLDGGGPPRDILVPRLRGDGVLMIARYELAGAVFRSGGTPHPYRYTGEEPAPPVTDPVPWRFHAEGSEVTGPCRRRWCFQCWRWRRVFAGKRRQAPSAS